MSNPFPCPKCDRLLQPAGEITYQGATFPTYQCDECTKLVELFGETHELALTFCINAAGQAFDPADEESTP